MLKLSPDKIAVVARMMLALVLFQGLFVALEVSAFPFHIAEEQSQYQLAVNDWCDAGACPALHTDDGFSSEHATSGNSVENYCDHCCTCQGHGPHTFVMAPDLWLPVKPVKVQSASYQGVFHSLSPSSIYRPPII